MVGIADAQEPQYETVTTMAEDVNCRDCHIESPHQIHAGKPVNCQNCHGESLSISIPKCTQCHTGPIHQVHINKVRTEDCSHCHSGIDTFHADMISSTLCSHCHKDLVEVHGGPAVGCERCHAKAPNIVKPVQVEGTTVICQNCHVSGDVSALHGDVQNKTACYRCHRPGSQVLETASEIPHFLHIPAVNCNDCHLSQQTGKIYIPECSQCHAVDKIHGFRGIGLKTASTGLKCGVCHPIEATQTRTPGRTATATALPGGGNNGEGPSGIPGFGLIAAIISLTALYLANKRRS